MMPSRIIGQVYNVVPICIVFESETANSETTSFHNCHACTHCSIIFFSYCQWLAWLSFAASIYYCTGFVYIVVYIIVSPYTLYDSLQMAVNSLFVSIHVSSILVMSDCHFLVSVMVVLHTSLKGVGDVLKSGCN